MRITVGHAERCTQRTGNTVIGISQAASPKAFPLQQMKKIVVMNAIVAGQRDIIVPRNTLPELEASHHDRIIQDFHMIDPGKRQLLRQITSERLSTDRVQERISRNSSDQDTPVKRRQQTQT